LISDKLSDILNKEQQKAVETIEGPLLVLAGAGTGKTRVITYRIAYMIEKGINPEKILGVTFTNKAAREMKERLSKIVQKSDADEVFLGTFHSFCARFLRKEIPLLGYLSNFTICDDSDQKGIIKQVMAEMNIHKDHINPADILSQISNTKSAMLLPSETVIYNNAIAPIFPNLYRNYNKILKNQNMVDFDDLLLLTVKILDEFEDVRKEYQSKYNYLLVDEYQDTNTLQFSLLDRLSEKHKNICVVGDDDQSIYGWRGANIENILNFPSLFPGATTIKLEQNYRSTNNILNAANKIISCNSSRHEKKLWSECGDGDPIKLIIADNEIQESSFIADAIIDSVGISYSYKDMVILYRSNHLSRLIEDAMRNNKIPYKIIGSKSFYDRKEIRDAVAYLKLIVNKYDDQSLQRILSTPPRGIGTKAVEKLREMQSVSYLPMTELLIHNDFLSKISSKASSSSQALIENIDKFRKSFAQHEQPLAEIAKDYLNEIGYIKGLLKMYKKRDEAEKRYENVQELFNALAQYENNYGQSGTLLEFLELYSLADANDKEEKDSETEDAVTLMTVHAAKGLEFKTVFIIAAEEKIFPNERAMNENSSEEERRLFYVAVTRAKERLIITRAKQRTQFGKKTNRTMRSRFLNEIPEELTVEKKAINAFEKVSIEAMQKAFENFTY
jgi:superfamily I DNA/RNA helicase